jgi:carbon-monoxide dehydrogenase small subunit
MHETQGERVTVRLRVNGQPVTVATEARRLLADVLREDLGLTGTHLACEQGACGACTVLVDRTPARSCLLFAAQADGREVTTVEGLGAPGRLHPLQAAFIQEHGLQCGFCTPGFLVMGAWLLDHVALPDRSAIREHLSGNLCRCTGYEQIVNAVERVLRERADGGTGT